MSKGKVIMAVSGGADSTTLMAYLLDQGYEVHGVWFDYGSKHNPYEMKAIEAVTDYYKVPLTKVDLKTAMQSFKSNLMKSGDEIPEGYYEAENMSQTVVPARNIIFASIATGLAWSLEATHVALGIHAGDHHIYPDCRPEFLYPMSTAVWEGTDKKVKLIAPFLFHTKADLIGIGLKLGVPYELTRTCYKDQEKPCGKCGACVERQEAFWLNGTKDPLEYEDDQYWKTVSKVYQEKNG